MVSLLGESEIALAVLIFPNLQLNYETVDDLQTVKLLPPFPEAAQQATTNSPDVRAARASVTEAGLGVSVARYAYLPSLGLDFFYGINANQFATRTDSATQATGQARCRILK